MIINGSLPDFVFTVIAKGQITLGDVRRLQRGYLPGGITNWEDLEILISLNAKLARADRAWAQWLIPVVSDFVRHVKHSGIHSKMAGANGLSGCLLRPPRS